MKFKHSNTSSVICAYVRLPMSAFNGSFYSPSEDANNYPSNGPMAQYTEISSNGDVLYQSDSIPRELAATYLQPRDTIVQRNAAMTGEKTSDQYRAPGIPDRFDNPGRPC